MYDETEKKMERKSHAQRTWQFHGLDLCEDTGGLMEGRQFVSVF